MKRNFIMPWFIFCLVSLYAQSQTTDIIILNATEAGRLKTWISENERAKQHYDSMVSQANQHLKDQPRPLNQIFYEGLLQTNPEWYTLLGPGTSESNYTSTWIGMLNSPLIRR